MASKLSDSDFRKLVDEVSNQLCVTVDGRFDFTVRVESDDETIEKLTMLVNFTLDAARRGIKQSEEKSKQLLRSEAEFRLLAESTPNIVFSMDPQGTLVFINGVWSSFTGLNAAEGVPDWKAALHPEDLAPVAECWRQSRESGEPLEVECRLKRFDGGYRWFLLRSKALRTAQGQIERWIGAMTEIHEQKAHREWLEAVLNKIPTPLTLIDLSGGVLYSNKASDQTLRLPRNRTVKSVAAMEVFRSPSGIPLAIDELPHSRIVRGEQINGMEVKYFRDGEELSLVFFGDMLPASNGFPAASILVFQDVTALHRLTDELKSANERLELFASIASHDLREPLRTISSYIKLLARNYHGKLDQNADELIHFATDGANRMRALVDQLLEYAHAGKHEGALVEVECDAVLQKALTNLKIAIEEKRATIKVSPLPTVMGDIVDFERLFQNLIGNAIKYNRSEHPEVEVSCVRRDKEWIFSVRDNGIGIDSSEQNRIFEAFHRLHGRTEFSGTGLGLTVCRRIVQANGGKIWVESIPGKGSTFCFSLMTGN